MATKGRACDMQGRTPLEALIQHEMYQRIHQCPNWNKLDMCFKWQLVQVFLKTDEVFASLEDTVRDKVLRIIRDRIRNNTLQDVEYSHADTRIVRLNVNHLLATA